MERTLALIQRAHQGDKEAREILFQENTGLIWSIVKRFKNRGTEAEDLFQIGNIGLLKAIDKFDLTFGVKFSTYAVPMISGEIKRFLRDDGLLKVSRSLKELAGKAGAGELAAACCRCMQQKQRAKTKTTTAGDERWLIRPEMSMVLMDFEVLLWVFGWFLRLVMRKRRGRGSEG